ncbi:MAG: lipocalin-like domain-containing protein [Azospirillaceae bacterium]|nr:lipocalin-like domain-containing protein [Azospirillaceae bacterium]
MDRLKGQWRLLSWRRVASNGTVSYPFGEDAAGLLVYTATGDMIVQMTAKNRPELPTSDPLGGSIEERAAAYSGYLAYFGSYIVHDDNVIHHIEGSSFPNWSHTEQSRPFERHGETLVLRTPPAETDGVTVVNEMSWRRHGEPGHGESGQGEPVGTRHSHSSGADAPSRKE